MIAHQFGHTAVFELLMQRSAPWLRLTQAAEIGDEALIEQILQQHASLFARLSPNATRRIIGANRVLESYTASWKSWAAGERPRRLTIALYGDLFALTHTRWRRSRLVNRKNLFGA
jgi:hypothetical protein